MGTLVILLFFASPIGIVILIVRNYQLEKRWRCLRYWWQSMSDFASERLRENGQLDEAWCEVVKEQIALMGRFGARPLTMADLRQYELALLERGLPILTEHKIFV